MIPSFAISKPIQFGQGLKLLGVRVQRKDQENGKHVKGLWRKISLKEKMQHVKNTDRQS